MSEVPLQDMCASQRREPPKRCLAPLVVPDPIPPETHTVREFIRKYTTGALSHTLDCSPPCDGRRMSEDEMIL